VDRFGQPSPTVKALLLYGEDNGIDGIVLEVLLRKHEKIRRDLGISVPVPPQSDAVLAALMEGVLMRGKDSDQLVLDFGLDTAATELDEQWRSTAEQEKLSRTRYAQARIRPDEVQAAVEAAQRSLGDPADIPSFVQTVLTDCDALVTPTDSGFIADLNNTPVGLLDALGRPAKPLPFATDFPAPRGTAVLTRTDPRVSAIGRYTLDAALDPALPASSRPARRCGMITTKGVDRLTVVVLVRFRTHLTLPARRGSTNHLAEEARALAFTGSPAAPEWLDSEQVDELLTVSADANTPPDLAKNTIEGVLNSLSSLTPHLETVAQNTAEQLRADHTAVRQAARGDRAGTLGIRGLNVTPHLPVDVLGVYVFLPAGTRS
jgi:hypothetical protein